MINNNRSSYEPPLPGLIVADFELELVKLRIKTAQLLKNIQAKQLASIEESLSECLEGFLALSQANDPHKFSKSQRSSVNRALSSLASAISALEKQQFDLSSIEANFLLMLAARLATLEPSPANKSNLFPPQFKAQPFEIKVSQAMRELFRAPPQRIAPSNTKSNELRVAVLRRNLDTQYLYMTNPTHLKALVEQLANDISKQPLSQVKKRLRACIRWYHELCHSPSFDKSQNRTLSGIRQVLFQIANDIEINRLQTRVNRLFTRIAHHQLHHIQAKIDKAYSLYKILSLKKSLQEPQEEALEKIKVDLWHVKRVWKLQRQINELTSKITSSLSIDKLDKYQRQYERLSRECNLLPLPLNDRPQVLASLEQSLQKVGTLFNQHPKYQRYVQASFKMGQLQHEFNTIWLFKSSQVFQAELAYQSRLDRDTQIYKESYKALYKSTNLSKRQKAIIKADFELLVKAKLLKPSSRLGGVFMRMQEVLTGFKKRCTAFARVLTRPWSFLLNKLLPSRQAKVEPAMVASRAANEDTMPLPVKELVSAPLVKAMQLSGEAIIKVEVLPTQRVAVVDKTTLITLPKQPVSRCSLFKASSLASNSKELKQAAWAESEASCQLKV